ncbi:MAG: 50S ribosomal protein L29 [Burkholderiales bacterium]
MKLTETKSKLNAMGKDELNQELMQTLKAQFNARMQLATQQMTNTSELKKNRRNIARIRTLLAKKGN